MFHVRKLFPALLTLALAAGWATVPAGAQERKLSFIRDAEIEATLRGYSLPIFQAAGIVPQGVDIYLVQSPTINAFVAGGQNLFINTGLLLAASNPEEIVGVIAHETGHIAGGHLARGQDAMERARRTALLSTLIGIAAAAASGQGGAGAAVIGGGMGAAQRSFLSFSRSMESSADQAAVGFLDRAGITTEGLLTFLQKLEDQELVPEDRRVEYVRTHPLTRERVDFIANHLAEHPGGSPMSAADAERFRRLQAKLLGFLSPQVALRRYAEGDPSVAARYARSIALFRRGDLPGAMALADGLLAEEPDNPYFHEWKGQMLLESGRVDEARPSYERAVALAPREPLLLVPLAQTKIESGNDADLAGAIEDLTTAIARSGRGDAMAWRLLATAYGRSGDLGMAAVALAEEAMARGDRGMAEGQAQRAMDQLPAGSPGWLRAQDVLREAGED
jgi:predicted Zn-dependent protease